MGKKSKNKGGAASDSEEECASLLESDGGSPTYEFYECLKEIHQRFDVDSDDVLSDVELRTYSRAANSDGREFTEQELAAIRGYFEWQKDGLTFEGFVHMCLKQAVRDEASTWQDLKQLGYDSQLELPQFCPNAKLLLTSNAALQVGLEEFVKLALVGKPEHFVARFAPDGLAGKDKQDYVQLLQSKGGAPLANLMAELKCCASGRDVVDIEGDQAEGPVTFNFWSPVEGEDGALSFFCKDGQWRSTHLKTLLAVSASSQPVPVAAAVSSGPTFGKKLKGYRR